MLTPGRTKHMSSIVMFIKSGPEKPVPNKGGSLPKLLFVKADLSRWEGDIRAHMLQLLHITEEDLPSSQPVTPQQQAGPRSSDLTLLPCEPKALSLSRSSRLDRRPRRRLDFDPLLLRLFASAIMPCSLSCARPELVPLLLLLSLLDLLRALPLLSLDPLLPATS